MTHADLSLAENHGIQARKLMQSLPGPLGCLERKLMQGLGSPSNLFVIRELCDHVW